jgi:hypothetical protein
MVPWGPLDYLLCSQVTVKQIFEQFPLYVVASSPYSSQTYVPLLNKVLAAPELNMYFLDTQILLEAPSLIDPHRLHVNYTSIAREGHTNDHGSLNRGTKKESRVEKILSANRMIHADK